LFRNLFGGKKPAVRSDRAEDRSVSEGPLVSMSKTYPWEGADDCVAANFALADLTNNLPRLLTVRGSIHPETLMAASGAIAGYAAQQALLAKLADDGETPQSGGLQIARTTDGRQWYFGDPLNWMLVPRSNAVAEASEKLWPLALGGAVSAGLDTARLPDLGSMFAHIASTIGGEKEGTTSLENYQFQRPAKDLLKAVWPLALKCFNSELSGQVLKPPLIVSQRWRPAIAAITANKMIRDVAAVLPPLAALTIVMEIAIYASKLPPETVAKD
jgi:hypothetical protein